MFDFSSALRVLKSGGTVARQGWNGKGMWVHYQVPDANSKMSLPYVYMKTADEKLVPWLISQTDVSAVDWVQLDQKPDDGVAAFFAADLPKNE